MTTRFAPFDRNLTATDDTGAVVRYLLTPLDETYLVEPGSSVLDGMLPPEDFEVREALAYMRVATEALMRVGVVARLVRSQRFIEAEGRAMRFQRNLRELVDSSPEHKAALRRIVAAMPQQNGGREALASYLK